MRWIVSSSAKNKPNDNVRIPLYFVLAFAIVFVVNGIFVYYAISTNSGMVEENAYENGLNYDRIVSQVREIKEKEQHAIGADTP